jgi:zinc transporter ZupT
VVPLIWYRNGIKKGTLHLLLGVSAGILLAIATVDLIPEGIAVSSVDYQKSYEKAQAEYLKKEHVHESKPAVSAGHEHDHDHDAHIAEFGRIVTMVGVGLGFLTLVLMEHMMLSMGVGHSHGAVEEGDVEHGHSHAHKDDDKKPQVLSETFSLTAFAALAIHSLVDGVVIGGSFRVSAKIGARVAVAIVLHKSPDGFVVASLLTATNRSRKPMWVAALSSITPIGAIVGYALLTGIRPSVLGGVLGFAAGTFLFISAAGIIPELLHEGDRKKGPIAAVILGWGGILLVNFVIAPHSH